MGISLSQGSPDVRPELEKGRKQSAEQHITSSYLIFLTILAAGIFAILSGFSSAYFTKLFNKYPEMMMFGGLGIFITFVIIFVCLYMLRKAIIPQSS